jgi:hypothetical protein
MTILEKSNFIGKIFMDGVNAQLSQDWTWGAAATIGLHQGLKYKGNIKTGLYGGLAVIIVLAGANGIFNLVSSWKDIYGGD